MTTTTQQQAIEEFKKPIKRKISLDDFVAYLPEHKYIFTPTGQMWVTAGVNGGLPPVKGKNKDGEDKDISPAAWLDDNRPVHHMTWLPGAPQLIHDVIMDGNGRIDKQGVVSFNRYRAPTITAGDASQAGPWIDHVKKVYPNEADHIIRWFAARVQRPADKVNHALVLGGTPGIGKDTILTAVRSAIGEQNFKDVEPKDILDGTYTEYAESVILRISEAHNVGDHNRFQLYDKTKTLMAAPPETFMVNRKYVPQYFVPNITGVVITSNHRDAFYLPPDDRRHFVAWSDMVRGDFDEEYFNRLYGWLDSGGYQNVAAYLQTLDISDFDIKAPPPKTPAFYELVALNESPEVNDLRVVFDGIDTPDAITLDSIKAAAGNQGIVVDWLSDPKTKKAAPHRLEKCGYTSIRNPDTQDGRWRMSDGKKSAVYAKRSLSHQDRLAAASRLCKVPADNKTQPTFKNIPTRKQLQEEEQCQTHTLN